ncbi:hypothetical protein [Streptomyces sp. NPDC006879]|uniref:hypothetical protein n=1 Tax=Streptomyces sp. NPDC006879 TaxID=3364767 RepID=UPI0036911AE7
MSDAGKSTNESRKQPAVETPASAAVETPAQALAGSVTEVSPDAPTETVEPSAEALCRATGETAGTQLDETALRDLFHGAVEGLEPARDSLDRLRHAIPARRARKRQLVVGAAAAVLLVGAAVPALVRLAQSSASGDDRRSFASRGLQDRGSTGGERPTGKGRYLRGTESPLPPTGSPRASGSPSPSASAKDEAPSKAPGGHGRDPGHPGGAKASAGSSAAPGRTPSPTKPPAAAQSPVCRAGQLATAFVDVGEPNGEGKVYGTFRITNTSASDCRVGGAGRITASAAGAADPARISVVDHTSADAASGLPDPSEQVSQLILRPAKSYDVEFAWVPSQACPTTPDPAPSPTAETPEEGADGGGTDGDATVGGSADSDGGQTSTEEPDLQAQGGALARATVDGSVSVSYAAEPGAPTARAVIPNACAGTVYRTGVLPVD